MYASVTYLVIETNMRRKEQNIQTNILYFTLKRFYKIRDFVASTNQLTFGVVYVSDTARHAVYKVVALATFAC